jgi:hypothetical protein
MDPQKREARKKLKALEELAKMLQAAGKEAPEPTLEIFQQEGDTDEEIRLEGEAVAQFVSHPEQFTVRNCGVCNLPFAANRLPVAYCSTKCVAKHLAETRIPWFPNHRSLEERWNYDVPLRVPAPFLLKLFDSMRESSEQFLLGVHREALVFQAQTSPDELPVQLNQEEDSEEDSVFDFD